ncbi:Flocculation suppression protein [Didymella glomerata]|uniref:Flocculation suppression protein n=1 Tax=Didymella glomerata TaxID=749621 RepID=A0A9W8WTJ1_9PLEO|nr:Flocculation suppression protein [Didymella glomerata]
MASVAEARRSPFSGDNNPNMHRSIPILPSSGSLAPPQDRMDITPSSTSAMGPPSLTAPSTDRQHLTPTHQTHAQSQLANGDSDNNAQNSNGSSAPAVGAAAAAQQPKVVQTAFIHKLYNMLEDQSIQHLISWSSTNESFVMSPSSEFSKVLSSYFKHTNISSFVRQLNMYGFHKVSDVFHTGSPDSPLWEFKHGNGNFKRGDLVGLREIKRRASRHALIHRDSFSTPKIPTGPPPAQTVEQQMPDPVESRLNALEYNMHNMHSQIQRSEDTCAYLSQKAAVLMEGMLRCHTWNRELTRQILDLVPDPEHTVHKNIAAMERDISRYTEMLNSAPIGGGDEQLRNALESYQLPRGPRGRTSRQGTPPDGPPSSSLNPDAGWTLPGARYPFKGFDTPGPPTRRSSMASNVHSLLNPAETAERADEDEPEDPRKRKRMQ